MALTIGEGEDARVYRTDDGTTSSATFRNTDPKEFYDCIVFKSDGHSREAKQAGMGDPVDGKFRIAATTDGGKLWQVQPTDGMPAALPGVFPVARYSRVGERAEVVEEP
ncbi:hypothetical protein ACXJJ3_25820 [Kribbella sp. WER1]